MERRHFLKAAGVTPILAALESSTQNEPAISFKDKLCLNQSTSMPHPFDVCMKAYAKAGIKNVEPWIHTIRPFIEKESTATARLVIEDLGLHVPSSCCQGELIEPNDKRPEALERFKSNIELVHDMGFPRFVVHSFSSQQYTLDDYKRGAENLREIAEIAAKANVTVCVEFIRMQRFLGTLPTSLRVVRAANHPNARPLFDFYHFWAGQGKMEDLELLQEGELEHTHFHDCPDWPREILQDKDRVLPGQGVTPLKSILEILRRKKYTGYFSVELFGQEFQEADPYEIAKQVIETAQPFLT